MARASSQKRWKGRVAVLQQAVPHYRVPFFQALLARCLDDGIHLTLIHGPEPAGAVPKSAGPGLLPPDHERWVPARPVAKGLVWQPLPKDLREADLVIVEQANRHLINHLLLARRWLGRPRPRLAFWGHGANLQADPGSLPERIKRALRRHADFWFCYTESVVAALAEIPPERKISVDNAIDTGALRAAVDAAARTVDKDRFHLLFIGSMRPYRRLDLLLPALEQVFVSEPRATIAFVGDGSEAPQVEAFCGRHPDRAIWHGSLMGSAAAPHLRRAGAIAIPGLIGLVALDSFVAEAPIVTTLNEGKDSPESSYLEDGVNAVITPSTPEAYAAALLDLMRDPGRLERLRDGCRASAGRYTIEHMAERFHEGIRRALDLK